MGNISNIVGGTFSPPVDKVVSSPEDQLRSDMIAHGLTPPDEIILDGKIHRFKSGTKGKGGFSDKTGWMVIYPDGVPAGVFGCWRAGIEVNFRADIGRSLSPAEEMAHVRRMTEAKKQRDAEREKSREVAANTVDTIWSGGTHASDEHGYLVKKGIQAHGARVTGDGRLMVPLIDSDGQISSIQYISTDGDKKYHPGGATGERFWSLGIESSSLYIAEGFATGATIHEATGQETIISYSASNLVPVLKLMREKYGQTKDIVIVADNDESGVGVKYAEQASAKYGARIVMPPERGDANDYVQNGGDLLALLEPKQDDWLISADDFSSQPAPISWLVKGWLQDEALIMVHGPSGGGKTFIVLDWCLSIAGGIDSWFGTRVKNGEVVYLAGEGHHGLRGRVAAWKQKRGVTKLSMWLSRDGCDLNTPEGYQRVVSNLRAMNIKPKIIVVDTLHRFLQGDENSSQDAKTMLDACGSLISEFGCSVCLVHHTGVSDEAQHRARGSSAWRGALDIEISISPPKNDGPIEIIQRKSKDAEMSEPLYCDLVSVPITGWFDEDNEPVSSAVIEQSDAPIDAKKEDMSTTAQKTFTRAWFASDCELHDGWPYVSKSAFLELLEKDGMKTSTANNYLKPSYPNGYVAKLINAEIISKKEFGWIISNEVIASSLMLMKSAS